MATADPPHLPDSAPWRTPAAPQDRPSKRVPEDDSAAAGESEHATRTEPSTTGGADESNEETVRPEPAHDISPAGGLGPLKDSGLIDEHPPKRDEKA